MGISSKMSVGISKRSVFFGVTVRVCCSKSGDNIIKHGLRDIDGSGRQPAAMGDDAARVDAQRYLRQQRQSLRQPVVPSRQQKQQIASKFVFWLYCTNIYFLVSGRIIAFIFDLFY